MNMITVGVMENMDLFIEKIYEEALDKLIKQLCSWEEAPYDVLRAFAITYFDLIFTPKYDRVDNTHKLICTPMWKDISEVDTQSDEFKLLHDYAMRGL